VTSRRREPVAWTVRLVPDDGGEPREVHLTVAQLRLLRWSAVGACVVVLGLVAVLCVSLPRSLAFGGLVEENLVLKQHLRDIDQRMAEVDRVLLRLRLYDAQLRSLSEPHGPVPADAWEARGAIDPVGPEVPMGEPGDQSAVPSDELRPAEAWATAVQARADTFLSLFEVAEPDINEVMVELEDLRALEEALPSRWPASGQFTSGFGFRPSPFGRQKLRFHSGVDIAAKRGTPIHAPAPGRVSDVSYNQGYGRVLEIDHGFGISTLYAHCTSIRVREGDEIQEGDFVATIGTTGRSTGPHLHFEVRIDGHPVDPLDYLPR